MSCPSSRHTCSRRYVVLEGPLEIIRSNRVAAVTGCRANAISSTEQVVAPVPAAGRWRHVREIPSAFDGSSQPLDRGIHFLNGDSCHGGSVTHVSNGLQGLSLEGEPRNPRLDGPVPPSVYVGPTVPPPDTDFAKPRPGTGTHLHVRGSFAVHDRLPDRPVCLGHRPNAVALTAGRIRRRSSGTCLMSTPVSSPLASSSDGKRRTCESHGLSYFV